MKAICYRNQVTRHAVDKGTRLTWGKNYTNKIWKMYEINIKITLEDVVCEVVGLLKMIQWRTYMNTLMKLRCKREFLNQMSGLSGS